MDQEAFDFADEPGGLRCSVAAQWTKSLATLSSRIVVAAGALTDPVTFIPHQPGAKGVGENPLLRRSR